jgi:hypothetical protein
MALPTSAVWLKKQHILTLTISAQTASFDLPFPMIANSIGACLQMTGTIGTAATSLQVSVDNVNFVDVALLQTTTVSHTELKALTIALSPYSMRLEDLAYPFLNLHHTAGGGSSIAFTMAMIEGRR